MDVNPLWNELRNKRCRDCGLWKTAQCVCLIGNGPVPAKIMGIGEAPGFREEEIEKPFQGAAGKYLDQVLERSGLKRSDIYLTNVVKCRPPNNRTPTPAEMKACHPYLAKEILAVRPEWVLLLGAAALSWLDMSGVMKSHGQVISRGYINYFITVHPSACLHNPANKPLFEQDIRTFAKLVRGEQSFRPKTKTHLVRGPDGLQKMLETLERAEVFSYDLEWWGDPWSEGGITMLGISTTPGEAWACLLNHPDARWDKSWRKVLAKFGPSLLDESKKKIAHNGEADNVWLRACGIPMQHTFDTMVAAHLVDENRSMSLENLSRALLQAPQYKGKADVRKGRDLEARLLAQRNGKDCDYTLRLYYILRQELNNQPRLRRIFRHISMPITDILADIELEGMVLDLKKLDEAAEKNEAQRQDLLRALRSHVPKAWKDREKAESHKKKGFKINFNSPQWVGKWLFGKRPDGLGLLNKHTTPSGQPATDEDTLLYLPGKAHPVVKLLLDYRLTEKYRSTYLEAYKGRVDKNGRVHISYNQTGTVTGRMSSDIHTTPRDGFIRSIWGAPPGWGFGQADYSQIEMRLAAMAANDRTMLRMFLEGRDPHTETAQEVLDTMEVTPAQRKKAKAVNFGYLYGMREKKFQETARTKYGLILSLEECGRYRAKWMNRYSEIPLWHDRQRRLANRHGEVTSAIGRIRRLPDVHSSESGLRAEAERQAINSPIQGLANDLTTLGGALCKERISRDRFRVIGFVHDAMLFYYRLDAAEEVLSIIKETMENLPLEEKFGMIMRVPIEVEVKIGAHWGEGKVWTSTPPE